METIKSCLIYATYPSFEDAQYAAQMLVEQRLAAGVNLIPGIHSFYWWENSPTTSQEVVLVAKTIVSYFEKITELLSKHHPYTCPCILQINIEKGYEPFLEWIRSETTTSSLE